ncbi:MAG: signal peptidase I [Thaumarchaeota archaeon]|nr:signal peptidase I [Nitrososphaerota archaeon]
MRQKKIKLFTLLLILPLLVYFWPIQLNGNTGYIMLVGDSMKGSIDSGTFVVTKSEQEYYLGDIIAFVNEDNRSVVHRIVDKTGDGFITKGDNNRKNDPLVVPLDDIIGRALFVIPYVGFTSLFLQSPIGMSIFGIWALAMFAKSRSKKGKNKEQDGFVIFKLAFIAVLVNYVITQSVLEMNIRLSKMLSIPFSNYFEPSIANTISFSMLIMAILVLYLFVHGIKDKKTDEAKLLRLIFFLGAIMILVLQLISILGIVPVLVSMINVEELVSSFF